jgi:flagellar M-ring protein FliF
VFDRFRAASPNQQLQMVVGGICLLAVLMFVVWFSLIRTTYQPLFRDLKVGDASAVVAELEHRKIPYRLADGGTSILVPSDAVDSTRLTVMGGTAPLKGTVGFELFNKADMGLTDFAQKINYQRALQGELERTIMTLDGIDTVRVHLSLGEDRLFRDDQVAPKASITVRMVKSAVLSQSAAQGMKRLVAAAVPKMDASDVVVLDEQGQMVSAPVVMAVSARPLSPALEEKRAVEQYYEGRIREAMSSAGLPADMTVSVSAEISSAASGLARWPAVRDFPLLVTLSSAASLDADTRDKARALAGKALAGGSAQNDVVTFGPPPVGADAVAVDEPPVPAIRHAPRDAVIATGLEEEHGLLPDWLLFTIPVLVVLFAGFLLMRKLRGPRRLDTKRQAEFVARLRAALEEGDGRAASGT